jgi:DNA invertase Pin-like site-specific DNA recombinase
MIAEFEADLARARTREGMAVARAKGRLRGKQPKLSPRQEAHLVELYRAGGHTIGELEELFPVTRSTIYRAVARAGGRATGTSAQSATRDDRSHRAHDARRLPRFDDRQHGRRDQHRFPR